MGSLPYVGDNVRSHVAERVDGPEREVDETAAGDHEVAAQELESPRPPEDPLCARARRRAETFERHLLATSAAEALDQMWRFQPADLGELPS